MNFKRLTAHYQGKDIVLFDGENFQNFNWLHDLLKSRYDDVNDDLMDGITRHQPGEWNADRTAWGWGMYVNGLTDDHYIFFEFIPADK